MTDQVIPEEAVEAALSAYEGSWVADATRQHLGEILKDVLYAAAPHMLAEAWEQGRQEGMRREYEVLAHISANEPSPSPAVNPYRE